MTDYTLAIRLTADGRALTGELRSATGEVRRFGSAATEGAATATRALSRTGDSVASISDQLRRARTEFVAFFTVRGIIEMARGVGEIADRWANLQGKLRTVTNEQSQLAAVSDRVFAIAQRTGTALDATATLAVKNTRVFLSMGLSHEAAQHRGLLLADTIQKALAISGATATEASSLVQQLGQALQSGVLNGDEFRAVMENGGRVVQALAEHTGKSVAELRKLSSEGKLTSQVILDAMGAAAAKIDEEFARNVPLTLGRGWQQLQNAVTRYIGEADQAAGASRSIAQVMVALGNNLDVVAQALLAVASAGAIAIGSSLVSAIGGAVIALRNKAQAAVQSRAAMFAELEMTGAVTAAKVRETAARSADVQATLQSIVVARQAATEQLATANARVASTGRVLETLRAQVRQVAVLQAAEGRLAQAQNARSAALAELAMLGRAQANVEMQLAAAANAQIAAQTRAVAADTAAATATSRLAAAKGLLASAGSAALAMIGGWPTVAIAAGAALVYYGTRATETSEEIARLNARTEELRRSGFSLADVYRALATGQELRKRSLLETMQAQLAANESEMRALELADANGAATAEQRSRYLQLGEVTIDLRSDVAALSAAQAELNFELRKAAAIDSVVGAYRVLQSAAQSAAQWVSKVTSESAALGRSLSDEVAKYDKSARELGKTQQQVQEINRQRAIAEKAQTLGVREGTEAYKLLVAEITKAYAPVIAAATAHDKATAAHKAKTEATRDATKADNEAETATSRFAAAQERLADYTARAAGGLSPMAKVAADYEMRLRDIAASGGKAIQALRDQAKATKDYTGLAAAEARVQQTVVAAIRATTAERDVDAAAIDQQADVLAEYLKQLRDDYATAGMTDRQRAIAEAVAEATREWQKNTDAHIENKQSLAELQDNVAATTAGLYDQAQAAERARDEADSYGRVVKSTMESAVDATADWAVSGFKHASDYWRSMVNLVKRAVAQMLAEWMKARIIGMFSNGGGFWGAGLSAIASGAFGGGGGGGVNLATNFANGGIDLSAGASSGNGLTMFNGSGLQAGTIVQNVAGRWVMSNPGTVGTIGAVGGAVLGGAYGLTQRGGSNFSGGSIAAAATYGVAGWAAGTAIAGGIIGGATAGTAGAIAGMSGALAAIPVIGWIALAIMLIDQLTGGKVFGSRFKTERFTQRIGLDAEGGFAEATVVESRQRALFRGRQWREREIPVSEEAAEAATQLEELITEARERTARTLGVAIAGIVSGSFQQIFDKKGELVEEASTVLGIVYKESFESFQKRLLAENVIAQIDAALSAGAAGNQASKVAERWRSDAEQLLAGAQYLILAARDIKEGTSLLGSDATIAAVTDLVEDLGQSNETLISTYERLVAETRNVVDAFALAGQRIKLVGADLVRYADDIATEAGGADAAAALWNRFFSSFYTQGELAQRRIEQLRPRAREGLESLGLSPDTTIQQYRDEFERRLPTLTAEQVVVWLRLGDTLATINELVAQTSDTLRTAQLNYAQFVVGIDQELADLNGTGFSEFQKALSQIGGRMLTNIRTANELARAAGLQGAREKDLARIHELAAAQAAAAARQLELSTRELVETLFGRDDIASQGESVGAALQDVATGLSAVQSAADRFREAMLLDDTLSPLNAQQQLDEAIAQLRRTGDEATARRALDVGRGLMASGADYRSLFDLVTSLVREQPSEGGSSTGGMRDTTIDEISPAERLAMGQQLAQNIADLAGFGGETFADVATRLGTSLTELGSVLGMQGDELNDYLESLQVSSYGLGDLAGIISGQVDRIVAAIHGTLPERGEGRFRLPESDEWGRSTPSPRGSNTGGGDRGPLRESGMVIDKPPAVTISGPRVERGGKTERVDVDARALGDKLDALLAALQTGFEDLTTVTAGVGGNTEQLLGSVGRGIADVGRELRSIADAPGSRGLRTRGDVR